MYSISLRAKGMGGAGGPSSFLSEGLGVHPTTCLSPCHGFGVVAAPNDLMGSSWLS